MTEELVSLSEITDKWAPSSKDADVYYRRLWGGERLMEMMDLGLGGQNHMQFGLCFDTSIPRTELQRRFSLAWQSCRFRWPSYAVTLDSLQYMRRVMAYRVPKSDDDVKKWTEMSLFIIERKGEDHIEDLRRQLTLQSLPNEHGVFTELYVLLNPDGKTHDLLLHSHHIFGDVHGIVSLFKHLLQLVEANEFPKLPWGQEVKSLAPHSLDAMQPLSTEETAVQAKRMKYKETLDLFTKYSPGYGSKIDHPPLGKLKASCQERIILSKEQTEVIVQGARAKGFTVTHAVQAAIFRAIVNINPPQKADSDRAFVLFPTTMNMRNRLRPEYLEKGYAGLAVGAAMTFVTVSDVAKGSDTEALNRSMAKLKDDYSFWMKYEYNVDILQTIGDYMMSGAAGQRPSYDDYYPYISSFGRLDAFESGFDDVKVVDFWVHLRQVVPNMAFHYWTLNDQMRIQICYNVDNYETATIKKHLDEVLRLVNLATAF